MVTRAEAARELLRRREARKHLQQYILYIDPKFKVSAFSRMVCAALDQFLADVRAGLRPILVFQAPPQHGKSELVSRKLASYLMGLEPDWRIAGASYNEDLAKTMAMDVRRNLVNPAHVMLFPVTEPQPYSKNAADEFSNPNGAGSYKAVGVGSGLTGRPLHIGIIDDPVKDAKEALSPTTKETHWNWYQTVFTSRMDEYSGQIIMATSWAEDDLAGRIMSQFAGDKRLKVLRFPALNLPTEVGYNPGLPEGPLVPELKSLQFLMEQKALYSDYWWSAIYQQSPKALGGNVFKEIGIQYYLPKDLPAKFEKVIASWDCTFKDTDGTDFVVGQVWGKLGADSYLLDQVRERMSFTRTVESVVSLREKHPRIREILIEDKANGPAVIDVLKKQVPGILPVEPDGSKLARAHAVTSFWEARNIWLPHKDIAPWVKALVDELTAFPAAANDDQVDALSQALRRLYPLFGSLKIGQDVLDRVRRAH